MLLQEMPRARFYAERISRKAFFSSAFEYFDIGSPSPVDVGMSDRDVWTESVFLAGRGDCDS
jgi:hypothetical protein